jgi:hypothetical protein
MRYRPLVFLALLAAHGPHQHHAHHPMLSNWHFGAHDASPRDFNRAASRVDKAGIEMVVDRRVDRIEMGNGAQLGLGFVSGHNVGVKFKLPF